MVNVAQIPNLPAVISMNGNELFECVQAGLSSRTSLSLMAGYLQATPLAALTVSSPLLRTANNIELTTVPATLGGTGLASYGVGDILYASGTTALSVLADVVSGNALISGGVGQPPDWGKINLSTHVSGTLAATNGGTGHSSYAVGDLLYASTTTALSALADVATGNALISGGISTAPAWGKIALTTHVSGILPIANGGTAAATTSANFVFVGPTTGAAAAPSFRALVPADIPGLGTGPLILPSRVATAAGTTTMSGTDFEVIINKTIAAANAVTLPATPVLGQLARVSDGKGDAFTNNITISPAAGNINGATTAVMNTNYGCFTFRYSGTEWNIVF